MFVSDQDRTARPPHHPVRAPPTSERTANDSRSSLFCPYFSSAMVARASSTASTRSSSTASVASLARWCFLRMTWKLPHSPHPFLHPPCKPRYPRDHQARDHWVERKLPFILHLRRWKWPDHCSQKFPRHLFINTVQLSQSRRIRWSSSKMSRWRHVMFRWWRTLPRCTPTRGRKSGRSCWRTRRKNPARGNRKLQRKVGPRRGRSLRQNVRHRKLRPRLTRPPLQRTKDPPQTWSPRQSLLATLRHCRRIWLECRSATSSGWRWRNRLNRNVRGRFWQLEVEKWERDRDEKDFRSLIQLYTILYE